MLYGAVGANSVALAQACPTPVVAANFSCTVAPGTVINVAPANAIGLLATGPLGSVTTNGVTLNLTAGNTRGAVANTGASITFNNSSIAGALVNQIGILALDPGSSIFATSSTIHLTGNNTPGVWANGGSVFLNNMAISTAGGSSSAGVLVFRSTGHAEITGGSVATTGNGPSANALAVRDQGAVLISNGTTISSSGSIAMAVVADDGGFAQLSGNRITTTGFNGIGLFNLVEELNTLSTRIDATQVAIETFGASAYGAYALRNDLPGTSVINLSNCPSSPTARIPSACAQRRGPR